jgi:hypothetical protein
MATNSNDGGFTSSLGAVLGIATTLVVGVFAALGVSGNLLARMVRNDPKSSSTILIGAIMAVVLLAIVAAFHAVPNWFAVVPVIVLGITLAAAARTGAESLGKRENPSVLLNVSQMPSEGLTLTVKATGSSLGRGDRMLVRVAAITRPLSVKESWYGDQWTTELKMVTNEECKRPELHPRDIKTARLLSWTETGPNISGDAATEQTMPIPDNAKYVCAWAILSERPEDEQARQKAPDKFQVPDDFALVDLADVGEPD